MKADTRDAIAAKFLEVLNSGVIPWSKPWNSRNGRPRNAISQKPYRGVNSLYLGMLAVHRGYPSGEWITLNQCKKAGGRVTGPEFRNGTAVVFWKFLKKEKVVNGVKVTETFPLCRSFTVWNVAQCENLPQRESIGSDVLPIESAAKVLEGMPNRPVINIVESESAYYSPLKDTVTLPLMSQFKSAEGFYSTAFHELAHATGHSSRLNRDGVMQSRGFGSTSYSREELVAEMTASFLSAECGFFDTVENNSMAYVQGWASVLNNDPRMIVEAAGLAQKAADYILGTTFEKVDDDE